MTEISPDQIDRTDNPAFTFGHCIAHTSLPFTEHRPASRPGDFLSEHGSEDDNDPRNTETGRVKTTDEEFTKEQWDEYTDALEEAIITVKMRKYDKYIKEEKNGTIQEAGKRFLRTIREQTNERLKEEKSEKECKTNGEQPKHEADKKATQTKGEERKEITDENNMSKEEESQLLMVTLKDVTTNCNP